MGEDLTKRSGIFKNFPVDVSNTFIKTVNNDGERLLIGSYFENHHTDVSNNVMLYLEGDAKFTKNVQFDGSLNSIDICGTLTADTLRIGESLTNNQEQGDYENCLIYIDASGELKATQIDYNKLEYTNALDFSGNSISVLEDDEFAVISTREYGKALIVRKKAINGGYEDFVGIKTSDPQVSLDISAVDAIQIPVGDTSERPGSSNAVHSAVRSGMMRYNTATSKFEGYSSNQWISLLTMDDNEHTTIDGSVEIGVNKSFRYIFFKFNGVEVSGSQFKEIECYIDGSNVALYKEVYLTDPDDITDTSPTIYGTVDYATDHYVDGNITSSSWSRTESAANYGNDILIDLNTNYKINDIQRIIIYNRSDDDSTNIYSLESSNSWIKIIMYLKKLKIQSQLQMVSSKTLISIILSV